MIHFKVVRLVYKKMADYLEERCVGDFCIKKFTVTEAYRVTENNFATKKEVRYIPIYAIFCLNDNKM